MMQPLNFTPKALADLRSLTFDDWPITRQGVGYLADKLAQAQVFLLPDSGELLDRSKALPEVPGIMFRPPFDVVALEYTVLHSGRYHPIYSAERASRRIALAWDWKADLPAPFARFNVLPEGVAIAALYYMDEQQHWGFAAGIHHLAYEAEWSSLAQETPSNFMSAMIANGSLAGANLKGQGPKVTSIPLMIEGLANAAPRVGGVNAAFDSIESDLADEQAAYIDLCLALACKNVSTEEKPAPKALNRQRIKKGKLPLTGFHVLKLRGDDMGAVGGGMADRNGPRSHLRRGHIRRLGPDRITWVNSTIVRGRGFLDKVYAV